MSEPTGTTTGTLILGYVKVLVWPVVIAIMLSVYHKAIMTLVRGSKVKFKFFGIEIETTIPDIENATSQMLGSRLLDYQQLNVLTELYKIEDNKIAVQKIASNKTALTDTEREMLRPIRNLGLIETIPQDEHLGSAKTLGLTHLGKFIMEHRVKKEQ